MLVENFCQISYLVILKYYLKQYEHILVKKSTISPYCVLHFGASSVLLLFGEGEPYRLPLPSGA